MRGLPSCGKTTAAKRIVEQGGEAFEFDEYFYTQVGSDPRRYDWSRSKLPEARTWNIQRVRDALDRGVSPVVFDDDNRTGYTTHACVTHALARGYEIDFREPDSPWWPTIRALLDDAKANASELQRWAEKLAVLSRGTHQVPVESFLRRMKRWRPELTVEDILAAHRAGEKHVRT